MNTSPWELTKADAKTEEVERLMSDSRPWEPFAVTIKNGGEYGESIQREIVWLRRRKVS